MDRITTDWSCPYCQWAIETEEEESSGRGNGHRRDRRDRLVAVTTHTISPRSRSPSPLDHLIESFQNPSFFPGHPDLLPPSPVPDLPPVPRTLPSLLNTSISTLNQQESSYFHPINVFRRAMQRSTTTPMIQSQTRLLDSLVSETEEMRNVQVGRSRHRIGTGGKEGKKGMEGVGKWKVTREMESMQSYCPICQELFHCFEDFTALSCLHKFHWSCIGEWMKSKTTCPVCRIVVLT